MEDIIYSFWFKTIQFQLEKNSLGFCIIISCKEEKNVICYKSLNEAMLRFEEMMDLVTYF